VSLAAFQTSSRMDRFSRADNFATIAIDAIAIAFSKDHLYGL